MLALIKPSDNDYSLLPWNLFCAEIIDFTSFFMPYYDEIWIYVRRIVLTIGYE